MYASIFRSLRGDPLPEDFEPDIFGIPQQETVDCETPSLVCLKDRQVMPAPPPPHPLDDYFELLHSPLFLTYQIDFENDL